MKTEMDFKPTEFEGLFLVKFKRFVDQRGVFIKPWVHNEVLEIFGNNMETYISSSDAGTIRGLHYQKGSAAQKKFVICLNGKIEDLAVDMRSKSATYGQSFNITLKALDGNGIIIPKGFAHGVFAHEDSIYINFCDQIYLPGEERGIIWSSIPDFKRLQVSIISEKDQNLPPLKEVL
jgi:dTDP-4-dehydrorhamnose 3,5-epimerase